MNYRWCRVSLFWAVFLAVWTPLSSVPAAALPAPNPAILWQACVGSHADDTYHAVEPTPDGGCIAVGFMTLPPVDTRTIHGRRELLAVKYGKTGTQLWKKTFGGFENDEACDLVVLADGSSLVVGSTNSSQGGVSGYHGGSDLWAVRLDTSGNVRWQKAYGGSLEDFGFGVVTAPDGGFVIAGATSSNDGNVGGNQIGRAHV
mgnify:FL=1